MTSVKQEPAVAMMTTAQMRAESDQINAAVREDNRSLFERSRRAAQLAYEAGLIDAAEDARTALAGARTHMEFLETEVEKTVAAEREAEDLLRGERRHLARRQAEEKRAADDLAQTLRQEELAIRVGVSARRVREREGVVAQRKT